jgi:hypothetical protein
MSVIVKTNKQKWIGEINKASGVAAYALAEQMLADSEKFVPFSGGSSQSAGGLRESGHVVQGENGTFYLVYDTVYALYQWFGVRADGSHRVKNYTTAGTGRQWVDKAKEQYGDRWRDIAQKQFTGALK